jgi:uncharacterized protein
MNSPVKIWRNQKHIRQLVGRRGTVLTWTVIRVPPSGYGDQVPYAVAIVELDGGTRITCQIADTDPQEVKIGMPVFLTVRKLKHPDADGVIMYGIKAVPSGTT